MFDYRELLNYAYEQYLSDAWTDDEKHLQLRFELVACISRLYLKLNLVRNSVNFIRQALLQFEIDHERQCFRSVVQVELHASCDSDSL